MAEKVKVGDAVSFVKRTSREEKTIYGVVTAMSGGGGTAWIKEILGPNKSWFHAVDVKDVIIIQPIKES
jgi:hypothetical protein